MIAKKNMPTEKRPAVIVAFIAQKMSTVSPIFYVLLQAFDSESCSSNGYSRK